MEKVVILYGHEHISTYDNKEINKYLDQGWRVKTIHTVTTREYVTAIFVLEK